MHVGRCIFSIALAGLALAAWAADAPPSTSTAPASQPLAIEPPITFARGGVEVEALMLPLRGGHGQIRKAVTLQAFGRTFSDPLDAMQTSAVTKTTVKVPRVRVPTVFSLVADKQVVGEVVVCPDRAVDFDKKITLYSSGAPQWFTAWADATGLPVKSIAQAELASARLTPADEKGRSLLILGRGVAGKAPADVAALGKDKKVNLLVLDASWFGERAGATSIAPPQMHPRLDEIAKQKWPQPLKFTSHRSPWPGIVNRFAWILDDQKLPLVEQIIVLPTDENAPATILSYVPWDRVLGREGSADATLLSMLAAAASAPPFSIGGYHGVNITVEPAALRAPDTTSVISSGRLLKATKDRPVLSAAFRGSHLQQTALGPSTIVILDLRGKLPFTEETRASVENSLKGGGTGPRLLILGDDSALADWEWLKLQRPKKDAFRLVELADDTLPPSPENQIRLMLTLTKLGVPLVPSEEKKGTDKP